MGHRAVVKIGGTPKINRSILSPSEMDRELGWQPRMLDFDDTPMHEIVSQFNKRNQVQLKLGDSSLEKIRFSNYFWSDNVEGFVRLMESSFGMRAEWRGSNEIVLRKPSPKPVRSQVNSKSNPGRSLSADETTKG